MGFAEMTQLAAQQVTHDTILAVMIPFQAVTLGGVIYVVRVMARLNKAWYQHELMWAEFAKAHDLPVNPNGGD